MNHSIKNIMATLILALSQPSLGADFFNLGEDSFTNLDNQPLLQSANVRYLAQDDLGFIWFGTETGLYRYDGYEVKVYKNDPQYPGSIPEDFIYAIWPAADGALWVGTTSMLSRYNPQTDSFTSHQHEADNPNSLINNEINQIHGAIDGGIWIGTYQGADYLAPNSKKFIHHQHDPSDSTSIASNEVFSFFRDQDGALLFGTSNGISRLNVSRSGFTHPYSDPNKSNSLSGQTIRSMFRDSLGKLWVGTDSHGLVWVGENNLIQRHHPSHAPYNALMEGQIWAIAQPNENEIWVATFSKGIFVLDVKDGRFLRRINPDPRLDTSISSDYVKNLMIDKSGLLWITQQGGRGGVSFINSHNQSSRMMYYKPQRSTGLSVDRINSISPSTNGNLWVAGRGINLLSPIHGRLNLPSTWLGELDKLARKDHPIIGFAEHDDGSLWAFQSRLGLTTNKLKTTSQSLPNKGLKDCANGSQFLSVASRYLLFSCNDSLEVIKYDTLTNTSQSLRPEVVNNRKSTQINQLLVDQNYRLWVATQQGLFSHPDIRLADDGIVIVKTSLPANNVSNLMLDADKNLWIDTDQGLFKHLNDNFIRLNEIENLPQGNVFGGNMLLSASGNIWGNKGLLDLDQSKFYSIVPADGLDLLRSRKNVNLKDTQDILMFANTNGILMVKPEKFTGWEYDPPLVLTGLIFNDQRKMFSQFKNLVIDSETRSFSIDIASLDFSSPSLNRYRYQLVGYDKNWIDTTAENRRITYSSLPPGKYELKIDGSNRQGSFGGNYLQLSIEVTPKWYQTVLFKLLTVAALIVMFYFIFSMRVRHLTSKRAELSSLIHNQRIELSKRNHELEAKREELDSRQQELESKTEELDNQNSELRTKTDALMDSLQELVLTQEHMIAKEKMASLGELVAGLAHEVNTPVGISVTAASHLYDKVALINSDYDNGKMTQQDLEKFLDNTQQSTDIMLTNLLRSAELIQNFKSMSVDGTNDAKTTFKLSECLNKIYISLTPQLKQSGHKFDIDCDDDWSITSQPGIISQIIVNLVMNSITHAFESNQSGNLSLVVEKNDDTYTLNYSDDGKGIPSDVIKKIFTPFFTTNKAAGGTGLGLSIVSNLVTQNLLGKIACDSTVNQGTTFKISIPA